MKRSWEKFYSVEEEENVYVYILLLELNNLKFWSLEVVAIFRVQEIEKKRIKGWEERILQKVEDLKKNFSVWQYIKQIIERLIIMKELFG